MEVSTLTEGQFQEYLTLADAEIRPAGAETHIWEDFPLLLAKENGPRVLGVVRGGQLVAGAACLVRQFQTSCGAIPVGGIGAVVTRPDCRGQGLSLALQEAVLKRLEESQVPLAVLWSDQPEIYAGRGFYPAGWEFHVDLAGLDSAHRLPDSFFVREYAPRDGEAVGVLYERHLYRTHRRAGDNALLYGMPGTRGLVVAGANDLAVAYVFCGKGSDFSSYITEWGGPVGLVIHLLEEVRRREMALHLLVPPGGEALAGQLVPRGAVPLAKSSGLWKIVQPQQLNRYLQGSGHGAPRDPSDAAAVLGAVGPDGVVDPGALTVAVWGFDSV